MNCIYWFLLLGVPAYNHSHCALCLNLTSYSFPQSWISRATFTKLKASNEKIDGVKDKSKSVLSDLR